MADSLFSVDVSFELFPAAVDRLLDSPTGPVGLEVKARAEKLRNIARGKIGTRFSGHHGGKHLAESGTVEPIGGAAYQVAFRKTDAKGVDIALLHHNGSVGHPIEAMKRNSKGQLIPMFRASPTPTSNKYPDPFGPALKVDHPGTDANPYLSSSIPQAGLVASGALLRGTKLTPIFRLGGGQQF